MSLLPKAETTINGPKSPDTVVCLPKQQKKLGPDSNPKRNDNSNPQQGTGGGARTMALSSAQNTGGMASSKTNPTPPQQQNELPRQSMKIPPTKKDARKLFVGGLPADVTDEEFRTFFEGYGQVMDSVVMFDRETHRSRGFGFVTFVDPEVSQRLLSMGNSEQAKGGPTPVSGRLPMRDKLIEIKAAQPRESSSHFGGNRRYNHPRGGSERRHTPINRPYGTPAPVEGQHQQGYNPSYGAYLPYSHQYYPYPQSHGQSFGAYAPPMYYPTQESHNGFAQFPAVANPVGAAYNHQQYYYHPSGVTDGAAMANPIPYGALPGFAHAAAPIPSHPPPPSAAPVQVSAMHPATPGIHGTELEKP